MEERGRREGRESVGMDTVLQILYHGFGTDHQAASFVHDLRDTQMSLPAYLQKNTPTLKSLIKNELSNPDAMIEQILGVLNRGYSGNYECSQFVKNLENVNLDKQSYLNQNK